MIVYGDILIVLNLIVDYFLLLATSKMLNRKPRLWRMFLSSFEGGFFSLYIFLPQSVFIIELMLRIAICLIISFTAFGFVNLKEFLKATGMYFAITCLYAGIMTAIWKILKPRGMVINNSVVYFDISAITLIGCTVIFYFIFVLFSKIFASYHNYADKCKVTIRYKEKESSFEAIIDTGNSVSDVFGNSEVIIADKSVVESLFGVVDINYNPTLKSRYRAIPCTTVSGAYILDGFRCDSAVLTLSGKDIELRNPILAVSKTPLWEGTGIVNPKIFQNVGVEYDNQNKKAYK